MQPMDPTSTPPVRLPDPPPASPVAGDADTTHVVLPGETLPSIARDYAVSVQDLQAANPDILNPDVLYPGDTLALPADAAAHPQRDPARPQDLLRALEQMPRPSLDDIPHVFAAETRQVIHDGQVADWLERRAALATEALSPPSQADFDALPPDMREAAYRESLADINAVRPQLEGVLRDAQVELLDFDATFQSLSLDAQSLVRFGLSQLAPESSDFQTLLMVGRSPGLAELDDQEQLTFMLLMNADGRQLGNTGLRIPVDGGTDLEVEFSIVSEFASQSGIEFGGEAVADPQVFRDFIDTNPTGFEQPFPTTPTVPYGISDPVYTNEITITEDGYLPLVTYYVDMDGQTIVVKVPDSPPADLNLPTIHQIAQSLAALPPESRGMIESVEVQGARRFDKPEAYMDISDGNVRVFPSDVEPTVAGVLGALVHESAHAIDRENRLGPFESLRWSIAMRSDRIDASDYARTDIGEDFAETYRLYMSVRGTPDETEARSLMPQRFALLDEMLA